MKRRPQGFAAIDPIVQRELASKGGRSVPEHKRSFRVNSDLALEAGKKGGRSVPAEKRPFSTNRTLASAAGKLGAAARRAKLAKRAKMEEK